MRGCVEVKGHGGVGLALFFHKTQVISLGDKVPSPAEGSHWPGQECWFPPVNLQHLWSRCWVSLFQHRESWLANLFYD